MEKLSVTNFNIAKAWWGSLTGLTLHASNWSGSDPWTGRKSTLGTQKDKLVKNCYTCMNK